MAHTRCVLDYQGHMHVCACIRSRTRVPTCTRKHAHTDKYIILIAFPLQQWFRERASVLHYAYIACLVWHSLILKLILTLSHLGIGVKCDFNLQPFTSSHFHFLAIVKSATFQVTFRLFRNQFILSSCDRIRPGARQGRWYLRSRRRHHHHHHHDGRLNFRTPCVFYNMLHS